MPMATRAPGAGGATGGTALTPVAGGAGDAGRRRRGAGGAGGAVSGGSSVIGALPVGVPGSEVVDGDAAVDDEIRTVRPARFVGREVDGDVDDLLWLAEATGRVAGE